MKAIRLTAVALAICFVITIAVQQSRAIFGQSSIPCAAHQTVSKGRQLAFSSALKIQCFSVSRSDASNDLTIEISTDNGRYELYMMAGANQPTIPTESRWPVIIERNSPYQPIPLSALGNDRHFTIAVAPLTSSGIFELGAYEGRPSGDVDEVARYEPTDGGGSYTPNVISYLQIESQNSVYIPFSASCVGSIRARVGMYDASRVEMSLIAPSGARVRNFTSSGEVRLATLSHQIRSSDVAAGDRWHLVVRNPDSRKLLRIDALEIVHPTGNCASARATATKTPTRRPTATPTRTPRPSSGSQQRDRQLVFRHRDSPSRSYRGARDVTLEQQWGNQNFGGSATCHLDGDNPSNSGQDRAVLLRWDISQIPQNSEVESAWITLTVERDSEHSDTTGTYDAFAMKRSWREGQATWRRRSDNQRWDEAGASGSADRDAAVIGSIGPTDGGQETLQLNRRGIALVQDWVDGTRNNRGILLASSSTPDGLDFYCSEASQRSDRPALTVIYSE